MKPHVKLAKNEQVWHGVSSSYFSIFSFIYFLFYLFFLLLLLVVFFFSFFLFFLFSFSFSCRNSLLGIFNY